MAKYTKWQFVFNTSLSTKFLRMNFSKAIQLIAPTGYQYFTWNDQVLDMNGVPVGYVRDLT